jgi:predicted RNA methylase
VRECVPSADITCVEIDPGACAVLRMRGFYMVHEGDFMECQPPSGTKRNRRVLPYYDAAVMNPPFTAGQDVDHVLHAWDFIGPHGVLVAVMTPTALRARKGERYDRFQDLHDRHSIIDPITLPAGTFAESGTDVVTMIIAWRKPSTSR